jgi:O-succinylbenzoic acid--CoA ligase
MSVHSESGYSYGFDSLSNVARGWDGVGPGDVVAVEEPLGPAWPEALAAGLDSGAAILPVDVRLAAPERQRLLARARPTHRLAGDRPEPLDDGLRVEPDIALVVATSGVTGRPKLVQLTRDAVDAAARASVEAVGAGPGDPWVWCMPPGHIGGLLVLLRAHVAGAPVVVVARAEPDAVANADATCISVVPTQLARLLQAPEVLARYRVVIVGGAGLPADLARRAAEAGVHLVRTYGLTESTGGVVYDGWALPGIGVRTAAGGEIQLAGPTLMRGYLRDPEATAAVFTDDGWLRTRDAGTLDPSGLLTVHGRLDDLIVTGGENVWPGEVEAALRDHPALDDVAVAAAPDPEWGSRVVAHVVLAEGAAEPSLESLREHAAATIARHKLPREVVVHATFPLTSSGKVDRARLGGGGPR